MGDKKDIKAVKRNWDSIFEEVEELTGIRLENVPLTRLWEEGRGRPPTRKADLLAKFCSLAPYSYIKRRELEKAKSEYLRDVRIKDKLNPYFQQAIRKASTVSCMRVKRAFDAFNKGNLKGDPWVEIVTLMMDQIQRELAKPVGERCKMDDIAERAGMEWARTLRNSKGQTRCVL
jgi:hypothetical protein